MKPYTYDVIAFKQQDQSPTELVFVAPANEVIEWAGVPRKSDELLAGYQRLKDNDRIDKEVVPFFQDPTNSSPTAIVVALRPNSGVGKCELKVASPVTRVPQKGTLRIYVDRDKLATDEVFEAALLYINERLKGPDENEPESVGTDDEDAEDDELLEDELDEENETLGDMQEVVHLGTVTLERMREKLEDRSNWANLGFKETIRDYAKPASIIDGQHRAFAASRLGIPFVVIGLYDAPWEEQVFQFTVVNLKPKRIPPSLITSIAGLSLTRQEQRKVEQRLEGAGVSMAEVSIMSLVAYDERSPFLDLVDMSTSSDSQSRKLGYAGVKRIAKEWYRASRTSLERILRNASDHKSLAAARKDWHAGIWFEFFVTFWTAIRRRYSPFWQKDGNKLFVASHLWALQESILKAVDYAPASTWQIAADNASAQSVDELKRILLEIVSENIAYLPDELWGAQWASTGLDTSEGRKRLVAVFDQFITEGKKGKGGWKAWKKDDFFKAG